MKRPDDVRALAALLASVMALGGCGVGSAFVSTPDRLPAKELPPLTRPLRFDVCGLSAEGRDRADAGDRFRKALWRAGVTAELTPVAGSPVDFTVSVGRGLDLGWSAYAALFTFSAVPGYFTQRTVLEADIAWNDAARTETPEHLQYEARATVLIWLPLVVAPDFWFVLADGWTSPKLDDAGFKQLVGRLGDDLRVRLGGGASESSPARARCATRAPGPS